MPNGYGGQKVRDPAFRAVHQQRARVEEKIPAKEWQPPAVYAEDPKKWTEADYAWVADPVLRQALTAQARSLRILVRRMRQNDITGRHLAATAEVSSAAAGAVFRGEVWPRASLMLRMCAVVGLSYGVFTPRDPTAPAASTPAPVSAQTSDNVAPVDQQQKGQKFALLRNAKRVSVERLAVRADVPAKVIEAFEAGTYELTREEADRLVAALRQ